MGEDDSQGTKREEAIEDGVMPPALKIGNLRHTIEKEREGKLKTIIDHRESLLKELFFMMQHSEDTDAIMQRSPNSMEIDEGQFKNFVQSYPLPINDHVLSDASITSRKPAMEVDTSIFPASIATDDVMVDSSNIDGAHNSESEMSERSLRPPPPRPIQRTKILTSAPRRVSSNGTPAAMCNKYPSSLKNKKERTTLDMYAWQLRVQDKLLMKTIRVPQKAILTDDWKVARREYKVMRALQRIEQLKMSNMWSFRQLRKSTAPLRTKTHWDHLLDEMHWMQTDFKEERKWKIAVAYQISRWVIDWHEADDKEALCVKRKLSINQNVDDDPMVNDDNDVTVKREPEDEGLGIADVFADSLGPSESNVKLELDSTIGSTHQRCSSADARLKRDVHFGVQNDDSKLVPVNSELEHSPPNLSHSNVEGDHNTSSFAHPSILFISPITTLIKNETLLKALFESYPIYEFSEPNDADPYIDDIETARVTMVSKLMTKRNRVSSNGLLQRKKKPPPSMRVKFSPETNGDRELPEWLVTAEMEAPSMLVVEPKPHMIAPSMHETGIITLFSVPPEAKSKMFTAITFLDKPRYRTERPPIVWTDEEDEMLMYLAQIYQHNWEFIADCLNSQKSKYASPTHERRSAFDCYERWAKNEHTVEKSTSGVNSGAIGIASSPGLNNAAGTAKSSRSKGTAQVGASPKLYPGQKLRRSVAIVEAMKKVERRRDIANDRPPSNPVRKASLELHANGNTSGDQIFSPADLSHLKSEKDRQASQALLAQQQHHVAAHYAMQGHLRPMIRPPMQGIPQYSQQVQSAMGNLPRSPSQPGRPVANNMGPNGSPSKPNGNRIPLSQPTTSSQAQAAHTAALLQQQQQQQAAGIALQQQQQHASIAARLQQQAGGRASQEQIQQMLAARGLVRPGIPTSGISTAGYQSPVQPPTNNQISVPHNISTSLSSESLATAAASMQQTPAGAQARMVHAQNMANQYHVQRLQLLQQQQLAAAAQAAANQDPQAQQLALQAAKNAQNAMANFVARGGTPMTVSGQPVTPELLAALEKRRAEELSKARSQIAAGSTLPGALANNSAVAQAMAARQKAHSPLIQTTSSPLVGSSVLSRSTTGSPAASPTPQQLAVARAAQAVAAASAAAAMRSPNLQNPVATPARSPNPVIVPSSSSLLSSSSPLSSTTLPTTTASALPSTEPSPALPTTYLSGTNGHGGTLQAQRGKK